MHMVRYVAKLSLNLCVCGNATSASHPGECPAPMKSHQLSSCAASKDSENKEMGEGHGVAR
jgi:hypothetical protein